MFLCFGDDKYTGEYYKRNRHYILCKEKTIFEHHKDLRQYFCSKMSIASYNVEKNLIHITVKCEKNTKYYSIQQ